MVPQPSPKRFPGSFFVKGARKSTKAINPLHLDALENRTTPAAGLGAHLFAVPEPYPEISLIAPVNPHEPLDLVGEKVAGWSVEAQEEASFEEGAFEEESSDLNELAEEWAETEVDETAEPAAEVSVPAAMPGSPSILVDMKRKPSAEPAEVARFVVRSLEIELGRHGTATAGARAFASDPVLASGWSSTSQFLIRPGLVKPIQNALSEKSPTRPSGQLVAWGAVMASGAAHLATSLPAKRRLTVESRPEY